LIARPDEISSTVRRLRLLKGLTIQDLADNSGIDRSFLSRLERGERDWTVETLGRVMRGLGEKIVVVFG
jgi:transcriptional regulator with XRE-family HTH domain